MGTVLADLSGMSRAGKTSADRWDYTVAELRQIAADHGLPAASRMAHDELGSLIDAAGISLPRKPPAA